MIASYSWLEFDDRVRLFHKSIYLVIYSLLLNATNLTSIVSYLHNKCEADKYVCVMKSKHRGWTLVITLSLIDVLILFFSRPHAWSSFGNLFFVHLLSAWNIFYGDIMIKPFKKQLARLACYTNHPGGYSRTVTEHIFIVTQIQGNLILKIVIFCVRWENMPLSTHSLHGSKRAFSIKDGVWPV